MPVTRAMSLPPPSSASETRTRFDKQGVPFEVRAFRESDLDALIDFYDAFEPKRAAQGLPPLGRDRVVRWLGNVLRGGTHLLALRDGELIGHALIIPMERPGSAEYAVFLRRDQRGRGVGTELNRAAIETAREAGLRRLWLSVEPFNRAAVRSYEKVGFRFLPGTIFSQETEMEMTL